MMNIILGNEIKYDEYLSLIHIYYILVKTQDNIITNQFKLLEALNINNNIVATICTTLKLETNESNPANTTNSTLLIVLFISNTIQHSHQ